MKADWSVPDERTMGSLGRALLVAVIVCAGGAALISFASAADAPSGSAAPADGPKTREDVDQEAPTEDGAEVRTGAHPIGGRGTPTPAVERNPNRRDGSGGNTRAEEDGTGAHTGAHPEQGRETPTPSPPSRKPPTP